MTHLATAMRFAAADGVPRRSLIVAVIIGTILNLINQGDALIASGPVDWLKVGLTYIVPYCVSTYGAVSYRLSVEGIQGEGIDDADRT